MRKSARDIKWHKLDNTAKIFPVITNEKLSNVFRLSVTLSEPVQKEVLQEALDLVLPWFRVFQVRLRKGFFWYYFETNKKKPVVEEEVTYPCRYIDPYANQNFLFRVSFYKKRINLEVFHVLTDGMGAFVFLKELTYQYLCLLHPGLRSVGEAGPHRDCTLNMEDSYLKYYKKIDVQGYATKKATLLEGRLLPPTVMRVIHGYIDLSGLKKVTKEYGVTINQYLVSGLVYAIYKEYVKGKKEQDPIRINVPVNLRALFESTTIQNFFAVLLAEFYVREEEYTFERILAIISSSLKEQMCKEHLEKLIAYNVSNEKKIIVRAVPLFIKNIAIRWIYHKSEKAFTTTLTNLGKMEVLPEYEAYIENFSVLLGVSPKQTMKTSACSFGNTLTFTFCSVLEDASIQKAFFRKIAADGVAVVIESNGGRDEEM